MLDGPGLVWIDEYSPYIHINQISKVLQWQIDRANSNANVKECNFKDDLTSKKYDACNITLETIRSNNSNKLIFAHLNMNSKLNF